MTNNCKTTELLQWFTLLLLGQLLCLIPDFGSKQEIGGDLHVAGSHLVDSLRDGH